MMALFLIMIETSRAAETTVTNDYVDSAVYLKALTAGMESAYTGKTATAMTNLVDQLSRKNCSLSLPVQSKNKLMPAEIYQQLKKSVLLVGTLNKCTKCTKWHAATASGFMLTKAGVMITNYHVVNNPTHKVMGAVDYAGKYYSAKEVLAADKDNDVAIIQLDSPGAEPLALSSSSAVGTSVFVISHPGNRLFSFSDGIISGYCVRAERNSKIKRMTITADYGVGSSGGPIIDDHGNVAGIVASTTPIFTGKVCNDHDYAQMIVKECIPSDAIRALITAEPAAKK